MHGVLLAGTATTSTPGEFRSSQNWIGPPGCTLDQATYVPPPPEHLVATLADLERFLHAEHELPPLIRYALIHYQFEAIHPFLDGNGRLGRLLVSLLLCADGILPQPLLYVSAFFERRRAEYYERLLAVTQRGEWHNWIRFFLQGVVEQARDAIWRSDQLLALQARYRAEARAAKASALVMQVLDELFVSPVITIPRVATTHHRSFSGAQLAVEKLVGLGVLSEATGRRRDRLFVASEIVRALEQPRSDAA
jgi:Fic family protein